MCDVALVLYIGYTPSMFGAKKPMTASEMGKRGIKITNSLLTPESRSKAAKKGWKLRKERLKNEATK